MSLLVCLTGCASTEESDKEKRRIVSQNAPVVRPLLPYSPPPSESPQEATPSGSDQESDDKAEHSGTDRERSNTLHTDEPEKSLVDKNPVSQQEGSQKENQSYGNGDQERKKQTKDKIALLLNSPDPKNEDGLIREVMTERNLSGEEIKYICGQSGDKGLFLLAVMRNEPYARRGYRFTSNKKIALHYQKKGWYKPTTTDQSAIFANKLSDIEKANIIALQQHEKAHEKGVPMLHGE